MCKTKDPKILMQRNSKRVPFSPNQVDYMTANGWSVVEPTPEPDPDPTPETEPEPDPTEMPDELGDE